MPGKSTTNSWLFPPNTREVQLDEKWSFVGKKEKHCDPADPDDAEQGDNWDHVALDAEHRLVVSVVPGKRTVENVEALVQDFKERTEGRPMNLITSDEYKPYRQVILKAYGEEIVPQRTGKPGRPKAAYYEPSPDLKYATVKKTRDKGRVVKTRKTYCFSKDWDMHVAVTYFTMYTYNFCWPVRTLRRQGPDGQWLPQTPAMAAGLTDHVWSLWKGLTFPAVQRE